jgi:hypothetical protein
MGRGRDAAVKPRENWYGKNATTYSPIFGLKDV